MAIANPAAAIETVQNCTETPHWASTRAARSSFSGVRKEPDPCGLTRPTPGKSVTIRRNCYCFPFGIACIISSKLKEVPFCNGAVAPHSAAG